jgi:gluconokinase
VSKIPVEIYEATCKTIKTVTDFCKAKGELLGISFSAAMHGVLALDKDGKQLTNLIIWADNRSSDIAIKLRSSQIGKKIYNNNGTPIHAMTPVCKLMWLKQNEPEIYKNTSRFVGIKEYVIYRLTGKFVVDYSIASATGMFNIRELKWDTYTLKKLGLKSEKLSETVSPYHISKNFLLIILPDFRKALRSSWAPATAAWRTWVAARSGPVRWPSRSVPVRRYVFVLISLIPTRSCRLFATCSTRKRTLSEGLRTMAPIIFEWLMNTFFPKEEYDTVF